MELEKGVVGYTKGEEMEGGQRREIGIRSRECNKGTQSRESILISAMLCEDMHRRKNQFSQKFAAAQMSSALMRYAPSFQRRRQMAFLVLTGQPGVS